MEQQQINYSDIIELGFTEECQSDSVYFNQYGFEYCIITKKLTKLLYIDWAKETRLCELIRLDNTKYCNIIKRKKIFNLDELKELVDFFCNDKNNKNNYNYENYA